MPRAKLSNVSLMQLVAELDRRKSRLADLLVQREAISKEIQELESLGFVTPSTQVPVAKARRGRPPGKRGPKPAAKRVTGKRLADYVTEVLAKAGKGLSLKDIEAQVLAAGYPTKAKTIYLQVVKVLAKGFKKVERGVYALKGATAAVKAAVAAPAKAPAAKGEATPKTEQFAQTAEQLILELVKGKGATTGEINEAWKKAGRSGVASPSLSQMLKAKKLKSEKLGGKKGSRYTAEPAPF